QLSCGTGRATAAVCCLSLHDALPISGLAARLRAGEPVDLYAGLAADLPSRVLARLVELPDSDVTVVKEFSRAALELFWAPLSERSEEHTSELQSRENLVCRLLPAKKK